MTNLGRRSFLAAALGVRPLAAEAQVVPPFVRLWANSRVSVEVPRTWTLLDGNQRADIAAGTEALTRRLAPNEPPQRGGTVLAANRFVGGVSRAWMNIRVYPDETVTQAELRRASPAEWREVDRSMRAQIGRVAAEMRAEVLRWRTPWLHTSRAGLAFMMVSYERSGIRGQPPVTVRLARYLGGSDTFTLTTAYTTDYYAVYGIVCEDMVESLRLG